MNDSRRRLDHKLIADGQSQFARGARWHFEGLSRAKIEQHAALTYIVMNGNGTLEPVEKYHVDGKAHAERMHRAAAFDQQRVVGRKLIMAQQTAHPFPRRFRDRYRDAEVVAANLKAAQFHSKPS
jgi:hypothetical protein